MSQGYWKVDGVEVLEVIAWNALFMKLVTGGWSDGFESGGGRGAPEAK